MKEGSNVLVNGYKIPSTLSLPVITNELVEEVKNNKAEEEIKMALFVDGIIYLLGVSPNFKHAKEYKEIIYKYNSDIENYILYKTQKLIENKEIDDGLVYSKALTELNDKNIKGLFNYAYALELRANKYFNLEQNDVATKFLKVSTELFENIIDMDSNNSLAYYKLGFHYVTMKKFLKAQIIWKKSLELDDDADRIEEIRQNLLKIQDDVTYEEGYYEILRNNSEKGLEKLLELKKRYEGWWNLLFMIGLGYKQLGKFETAKKEFEGVLEIEEEQVDTLNELGLCSANMGQFEEAIEFFSRAIDKRPKDYEIACNRGMTYLQIGKLDKAVEDIEKAYMENPNDEVTIRCKEEIERIKKMA